jgi:transcription elongation factor GreB
MRESPPGLCLCLARPPLRVNQPARWHAWLVSKAFTKDDQPSDPVVVRHRHPLPADVPNYVTPAGLRGLRDELARLQAAVTGHPPTSEGDLGPREELQAQAARRAELEERIATAVVAAPPDDRSAIRFGARVRLRDARGTHTIQIVGVDQADPASGLVAFVAPLARALLGRHAGEPVTLRTPGGEEDLEVLDVDYDPA